MTLVLNTMQSFKKSFQFLFFAYVLLISFLCFHFLMLHFRNNMFCIMSLELSFEKQISIPTVLNLQFRVQFSSTPETLKFNPKAKSTLEENLCNKTFVFYPVLNLFFFLYFQVTFIILFSLVK